MATRISPPQNKTYYINPAYLTFVENSGYGANLIQVSASSSCYISVYDPDNDIKYNDADRNYRRWKITAYNNKFPSNAKFYIYARLEQSGSAALVIYDQVLRGVKGGEITVSKDEDGNNIYTEAETTQTDYFYILIGEVGETDGESIREITYDTGYLESDQGKEDSNGLNEMWEIDKYSTPWLIKAKQWLYSFTVKGFVKIIGGFTFSKGKDGDSKTISDIKRSVDSDEEFLKNEDGEVQEDEDGNPVKNPEYVPLSDDTIPTSAYLEKYTDRHFLRKDKEDTAKENITFEKGIHLGKKTDGKGFSVEDGTVKGLIDELKKILLVESADFLQGELGSGFVLKYDKDKHRSYLEVDELLVRKLAYFVSLVIKELKHVGGTLILSPASMKCSMVETYDTFYRCYFESEQDGKTINNEFQAGDLARCQTFNVKEGVNSNVRNTYYWRYVTNVGNNFIDLSITDCDAGSGIPQKGDEIVQLGNRWDDSRQNAIILSTVGDDAPSFKQYQGINNYYLSDDNAVTIFSPYNNVIKGKFLSQVTGKDYDEELKKLQVDWDSVLEQTDKEFTMWFFEHTPTLDNEPAVNWDSEELKQLHDQDLFYDRSSGLAYRFENVGGVWMWSIVTDADTIRALEKADEANKKADEITNRIDEIVDDNILSALEKKEVLKEWDTITSAYSVNLDNASAYDVPSDDYTSAYLALGTYLNGGFIWDGNGIPSWLSDYLLENTPIISDEYRSAWVNYYNAEKAVIDAISQAIDNKVEDVKKDIEEIVSDGILSALEKKEVLKEWEAIVSAYPINMNNASKYNVSTDDYTSAYLALGSCLNGGQWNGTGTPSWLGEMIGENTPIDAESYRTAWVNYYDAEASLLDTISDVIKGIADNKKRVFVDTPCPPYDVGDMWVNATATWGDIKYNNDTLVCIASRSEGESFNISDWRLPNGYSSATFEATNKKIEGIVKSVDEHEEQISELTQTAERISAIVSKIDFDENGLITSFSKAGLLIEDDFAGLFVQHLDDELEVSGKISVAISNGIVNATIHADQIQMNGYTIINDHFTVDTNGNVTMHDFTANNATIYGELNVSTSYYDVYVGPNGDNYSRPSIELRKDGNVYAYMGLVDIYGVTSGGNMFLVGTNGSVLQMTGQEGVSVSSNNDDKHVALYHDGLFLYGGAAISNLTISGIAYTSSTLYDFNFVSSNLTLPDPSQHRGRIIFVKGTAETASVECSGKIVARDKTSVSDSATIYKESRIFVSNGTYWYEFHCG